MGLTGDGGPRRHVSGDREPDAELVRRATAGDTAAFSTLVERYQGPVYSLTARMLGPDAGEDAAQESFVRAFRGLPRFRGQAGFGTWLLRITANVCIDHDRRRRRTTPGEIDAASRAVDPSPGPPEIVLRRERDGTVAAAVAALQPHYRLAVVLRYVHGLGHREIAAVCGVARRTVETRLYRARALLRRQLDPWLDPPGRSPPAGSGDGRSPPERDDRTEVGGDEASEPPEE